jgi:NADPH-dependent curcumin reductase CurA
MRGWLNDTRSYIEPVKIGEAMRAAGIATVVSTGACYSYLLHLSALSTLNARLAGPGSAFRTGDLVTGTVGWQEYAVVPDKGLEKITYVVPPAYSSNAANGYV